MAVAGGADFAFDAGDAGANKSLGRSIALSTKGAYIESNAPGDENKRGLSGITYLTGLKSLANPTREY